MLRKVLVIKLGTAVITNKEGTIDSNIVRKLAGEVALLREAYNIIIVSSGAVGSGKKFLNNYKGSLSERKAAAAVGNPLLIQLYHQHFKKHGITVAQALCERVLWMHQGRVLEDGPARQVVGNYLRTFSSAVAEQQWDAASAPGNEHIRMHAARVRPVGGAAGHDIDVTTPVVLEAVSFNVWNS